MMVYLAVGVVGVDGVAWLPPTLLMRRYVIIGDDDELLSWTVRSKGVSWNHRRLMGQLTTNSRLSLRAGHLGSVDHCKRR